MTPALDRDRQFHLLVSEEERENLKILADAYGMTQSDYVRHLIGWQLEEVAPHLKNQARRDRLRDIGLLRKAKLARWDADRMERRLEAAGLDPADAHESAAAIRDLKEKRRKR